MSRYDVAHGHSSRPKETGAAIRSEDLFGKAREVQLEHRGEIYRLRITRQEKLILTK
ncbi:MAG: hypothetical protein NFCOHLIN_00429 [Gammaproteobacteria bacterium]|nr:hypothetical protein [Gammaproteobacteria bacterium]